MSVQLSDASVNSLFESTTFSLADNDGEAFVSHNAVFDPLLAETFDPDSAEFPTFADIAYPEDVYKYLAGPFYEFVPLLRTASRYCAYPKPPAYCVLVRWPVGARTRGRF